MWWGNKLFIMIIIVIVFGIFWSVDCFCFYFVCGWIVGGFCYFNLRDNNYKEEKNVWDKV